MAGIHVTLSEDAMPQSPTILITQSADGDIWVNCLGIRAEAGQAVSELLHDIADGLQEAIASEQFSASKEQHLDSENGPVDTAPVPTFDPQDTANLSKDEAAELSSEEARRALLRERSKDAPKPSRPKFAPH